MCPWSREGTWEETGSRKLTALLVLLYDFGASLTTQNPGPQKGRNDPLHRTTMKSQCAGLWGTPATGVHGTGVHHCHLLR